MSWICSGVSSTVGPAVVIHLASIYGMNAHPMPAIGNNCGLLNKPGPNTQSLWSLLSMRTLSPLGLWIALFTNCERNLIHLRSRNPLTTPYDQGHSNPGWGQQLTSPLLNDSSPEGPALTAGLRAKNSHPRHNGLSFGKEPLFGISHHTEDSQRDGQSSAPTPRCRESLPTLLVGICCIKAHRHSLDRSDQLAEREGRRVASCNNWLVDWFINSRNVYWKK